MKISIIVAFDENRLIGRNNELPWRLPADLKFFKSVTMGHPIIMGRKTFESIGRVLPGRTSVIVTRQQDYTAPGCVVVNSLKEALEKCGSQEQAFIIGGAELFQHALPLASDLYITEIHHRFEGDTWFPEIRKDQWQEISVENHKADDRNQWDYTFIHLKRKMVL
jgi:dihydrofolate reductase